MSYDHAEIDRKWQEIWEREKTFRLVDDPTRPKYYVLDMFPYPSGEGLHIGHPEGYTATDIMARFKRMRGFCVLHPMGWDSFGLPAEQYAMQKGIHPDQSTRANIATFKRQLRMIGFSYDWDREFSTSDPSFYKWTQWIFLKLLERGLAYQEEVAVNWCPALGTVLANDEVVDGKSERGGHPVERRPMRQWMLRITSYADRLLEGLDRVDFPESIKAMQRERIGRSEGAQVRFKVRGSSESFDIFTTRPDTLFGATFCVLSPEHPLVAKVTTAAQAAEVQAYVKAAATKSEIERQGPLAAKSGVFTGSYALNPASGESVPIWIADYVLMSYGTGAIMAVPGHDQRDWEFARAHNLQVRAVVQGGDPALGAYDGDGPHIQSGFLDGKGKEAAIKAMNDWLEKQGVGQRTIKYKMRDWIFARQRYWGEPVPVIHAQDGVVKPLSESELPLLLPPMDDFKPTGDGDGPLARLGDWVRVGLPGGEGRRETHTMPGSAGSSWYFFRFIDPSNQRAFCDAALMSRWMPVDLYIGGAEHAVGHLLYSRFWTKVLYDMGLCPVDEPYAKLVNQGMILGEDGQKMSKRLGNVINPDDVVREWGADSLRLFEMFLGPLEVDKPWNTKGIEGVRRLLERAWRLVIAERDGVVDPRLAEGPCPESLERLRHRTIRIVTADIEGLRFNTAISRLMEFVNALTKEEKRPRVAVETLLILLNPFAPHVTEELWERMGRRERLSLHPWPTFDLALASDDEVEVAVQLAGKVKARLKVPAGLDAKALEAAAMAHPEVKALLGAQVPKKIVAVPGRLVNIIL
ncbi:MAG: leucine--tRNA ligase [Planctomycetota bacterium]